MAKPHPQRIHLKQTSCPECKEPFGAPRLTMEEMSVLVRCSNAGCGYSTELFWIGDKKPRMN